MQQRQLNVNTEYSLFIQDPISPETRAEQLIKCLILITLMEATIT